MIPSVPTHYYRHQSPVGPLLLAGNKDALTHITFPKGQGKKLEVSAEWEESPRPFSDTVRQLDEYFRGKRTSFELALAPSGTTFQLRVWAALQEIPYGETRSYISVARHIGKPNGSRAVGNANGLNPISIVIPCHRVIGKDGSLTGFGGGLPTKSFLLNLEDNTQLQLPL